VPAREGDPEFDPERLRECRRRGERRGTRPGWPSRTGSGGRRSSTPQSP